MQADLLCVCYCQVLPQKPYLATALAAVRSNAAWLERHAEKLCDWLDDR